MQTQFSLHPQPDTILPAKIHPPGLRENRVERHHLLSRLDAAETKVSLIIAPAGSGKSTLLSQWADSCAAPTAWISLGQEDSALSGFIVSLIASISEVDAALVDKIDSHLTTIDAIEVRTFASVILIEIARHSEPWMLILDDYHVIENTDVHDFLVELIGAMPDGCRLVIASRGEPPIPIARLRILEELTTISAGDLRATVAEARELLDLYSIDAIEQQLEELVERTAGWMVAIHLIALASRTAPIEDVIESLSTFRGHLDLLSDYLFYEVLCQQTPELRAFLLQMSVLDRFTADCCYAVTGNGMAVQLLDQVRRGGLFLLNLDEMGTWLSLRNPFREFLRHRLQLEFAPDAVSQLHAAASAWYWRHNLAEVAVAHAIQAGDWTRATTMITSVATDIFVQHRLGDLGDWVQSFPRDLVLSDPNLSSIMAYVLVRQGHTSESELFLREAEQRWQADGLATGRALIALIRGDEARAREDGPELIAYGAKSIELVTGESVMTDDGVRADIQPRLMSLYGTWMEPLSQMTGYLYLAYGLVRTGRLDEAEPLIQRMQTAYEAAGVDLANTSMTPLIALMRVAQGKLHQAEAIARPFALPVRDNRPNGRATACEALAETLYQWNRVSEAYQVAGDGLDILQQAGRVTNGLGLWILRARIDWLNGNVDRAIETLDEAVNTGTVLQNQPSLRDATALRAQFALVAGDLEHVRHWAMVRSFSPDTSPNEATILELLTYVRLLLANGDAEAAAPLLSRFRETVTRSGRYHDLIKVLVAESIVFLDLFELDQAVATLGEALAIAEAGGYQRVFLDEGAPMLRLLRIAHRRGLAVNYIRELLLAAGETPGAVVRMTHRELVEPITAREIEVLGLVTLGLTNKEISDELYLSVATVKRHITNLYGKLGVSSRTEAVQRARRLGLLSTEHVPARPLPSELQMG